MALQNNEEREAAIKAVEAWLWHQGEWPGHKKIGDCMAFWVECWEREKDNGMDVLATMHAEHLVELATAIQEI